MPQFNSAIFAMDRAARERKRSEEAEVAYEPWNDISNPDEREYFKNMNRSGVRRVTNQGDGAVLGGGGGRSASMAALAGGGVGQQPSSVGANDYLATADRGNENRRSEVASAVLDAQDTARFGAEVNQGVVDSDLYSGDRQRRSSGMQGVADKTAFDSYFSPDQRLIREDKERASTAALRTRYSDPAIIKGQADLDRELMRNEGRYGQENIRQRGNAIRGAMDGRSRIGAAIANQGDIETAGDYAPPAADASLQAFPRAMLADFMAENGFATEQEAVDMLQKAGYAVR